ncbi:MAG: cyclase family protein [Acidimicrobiales bacterium]|jgi:kynurenine formamidase
MSFFDLTVPIENGMTYFPGDPEPRVARVLGEGPSVSELHLGSHTGTHVDAACHYFPGRTAIDRYPIERFIVPGVVVAIVGLTDDQPIAWEMVEPGLARLPAGGAAVLFTGWSCHFRDEHCLRHPYLAAETARGLAELGAGIVGIDAMNPDSSVQGTSHVHEILLGAGVLLVENLTGLERLEPGRLYQFAFLPLRLAGVDGSPIRAVAWEA